MTGWRKRHSRALVMLGILLGLAGFFYGLGWVGAMHEVGAGIIGGFFLFLAMACVAGLLADEPEGCHSSIYPDH